MCVIVTCALLSRMILWSLAIWSTFSILKIQFSCLTYSSSEKKFFIPLLSYSSNPMWFPPPGWGWSVREIIVKTNLSPLPVFNVVKRRNLYTRRFLGVWLAPPLALGFIFPKTKLFLSILQIVFCRRERKQSPSHFVVVPKAHSHDIPGCFQERTSVNGILQILPFLSPARSCSGRSYSRKKSLSLSIN